jgi:hypothetical protein
LAAQRASGTSAGSSSLRQAGLSLRPIVQALLIAATAAGVASLVWLYANALRDPRYLDGWILACGMLVQIYFHVALKTARITPKNAARWRSLHIMLGYVLIAAFISHANLTFPDTAFEWALWTAFVLVAVSGVIGTYLAWSLKARSGTADGITFDAIPTKRDDFARKVYAAVTEIPAPADQIGLPAPPYDAWILDLYANHLRDFLQGPRNLLAHVVRSQRPAKRLTDEIDSLSRYVDAARQERLAAIKELVIEKDRLDFAHVYLGLNKGWLFIHVPATYTLIVMSLLHVVVVYAFSSGAW